MINKVHINNYINLQEYLLVHGVRIAEEEHTYGISGLEFVDNKEDFLKDKSKMWTGLVGEMYIELYKTTKHVQFSIHYSTAYRKFMVSLGTSTVYYPAELFKAPTNTNQEILYKYSKENL